VEEKENKCPKNWGSTPIRFEIFRNIPQHVCPFPNYFLDFNNPALKKSAFSFEIVFEDIVIADWGTMRCVTFN